VKYRFFVFSPAERTPTTFYIEGFAAKLARPGIHVGFPGGLRIEKEECL